MPDNSLDDQYPLQSAWSPKLIHKGCPEKMHTQG